MLKVEFLNAVLHVTLDRPEVRNAFNEAIIAALTQTFKQLPDGTRAVVIGGTGEAFCSGGDLNWMRRAAARTEQENYEDALALAKLYRQINESHVPFIAKVQGAAFGGGCGLVAACDIAIASPLARFAFSEVRLGLVPATISRYVVPKIGRSYARKLFITGEQFPAAEALRIGLIHEIADDLSLAVDLTLAHILKGGPVAIAATKLVAFHPPKTDTDAAWLLARARRSEEGKEGVQAFLEKRTADFVEVYPPED